MEKCELKSFAAAAAAALIDSEMVATMTGSKSFFYFFVSLSTFKAYCCPSLARLPFISQKESLACPLVQEGWSFFLSCQEDIAAAAAAAAGGGYSYCFLLI